MMGRAKEVWEKLYSKHGLQYGGSGDIGLLEGHLRRGMLVLDAGCGDGKTAEVLMRRCEVVGCDFSREALLSLRTQRDRDGVVSLVESELGFLPFESEKFDAVVCIHTLSHMLNDGRLKAANELHRVLKQSGFLLVEGFGRNDIRYGEGVEVEPSSFLRGNGIVTHYFAEGEIPSLFPGLLTVSEVSSGRRVAFGPVAGRRNLIKALMRKA